MKTQILAAIGETGLQQAAALNAGLAANDRIKYVFSLLQMALDHAEHPDRPAPTLKQERLACGIDDTGLDNVAQGARMDGKACHVPHLGAIMGRIVDDLRLMAAPVIAAKEDGVQERLEALLADLPAVHNDDANPHAVSAMMRAGHGGADSAHRLVMDLHKRLNALQAGLAQEVIDGASAYGLDAADRPLVSAFMTGLQRTAPLKFNHPGLATTATRAGGRLVIQNDIGTTDAHVIVIHVEGLVVSVTYTDVHPERLAFFQQMLAPQNTVWEAGHTATLSDGDAFTMATGRMTAADDAALPAVLTFLGSRLVFLIDWNRARKQLRSFLRGPDRVALLAWAAEAELGHRGFLEMGGAHLVNQAIEATAGSSMHFGDRLCDVLGDADTISFLHFVFRAATEGVLGGQSQPLVHDRIRVALAAHFNNEELQLLERAAEHAGLIFELAALARDGVQEDATGAAKRARRAARFEHDADQILADTRAAVRRRPDHAVFLPLLQAADEAANALEDAAFLLELEPLKGHALGALQSLADLLSEASQEWVKAVGSAGRIGRLSGAGETEDFLTAIDRIVALERAADDAERALAASAIKHAGDFRQLHLFTAVGSKFEMAADALKHASQILREHVLEDVIDA